MKIENGYLYQEYEPTPDNPCEIKFKDLKGLNLLEVGMYVRTKNHNGFAGGIGKIEKIQDDKTHKTKWITLDRSLDGISFLVNISEIVIASYNIIDLIEVGDYVNGMKVSEVIKNPRTNDIKEHLIVFADEIHNTLYSIYADEIKSIVTHEQFERVSYKLGDEK